jgi:hypothetical protein
MMDRSIEWITISTGVPGKYRTLTTVAGLAEFLLQECPDAKAAQQSCLDALEGKIPEEDARAAFADAITAAGLHVLNPQPSLAPADFKTPNWHRSKSKRRS